MNQTNRTILLIEDDEILQRFLTLALKTNGYDVLQAKEGAIGLAILANQHADLILLDLGLPDMDGIDVLKEIQTITSQNHLISVKCLQELGLLYVLSLHYLTFCLNINN